MINRYIIKKGAAIFALCVSSVLFLPDALFAQGAVVGYAYGLGWIGKPPNYPAYTDFPSTQQLNRLTHVIASDIGCQYNGTLYIAKLPNNWNSIPSNYNWNGEKNLWLESLVSRAHLNGVKVSICVGGDYFSSATNSTYLNTFVANIVSFVNLHGLDGVDIDWEPASMLTSNQWNQCVALLTALKGHPSFLCKRISIALPHSNWFYPSPTTQQQIWDNVDAIHLMSYDVAEWPTSHSNAAYSIGAINAWVTWGTPNLYKEKLFLGCAFYGYNTPYSSSWSDATKVNYATYSAGGFSGNRGDLIADVQNKVNHCYVNGYGGVMIWELGYDKILPNDNPELLDAIWTKNSTSPNNGYPNVSITTQPASTTSIAQGASGSLSVGTNKPCNEVMYQWYSNTTNSNSGGTLISGATGTNYSIPTSSAGTYYYFCEVKGKNTVRSNVATVIVLIPISISGQSTICSYGYYKLSNDAVANWTISSGFSVYPSTGASVYVSTAVSNPPSSFTLTAVSNGQTYNKTVQYMPGMLCPWPPTDYIYDINLPCQSYVTITPHVPSNYYQHTATYRWDIISKDSVSVYDNATYASLFFYESGHCRMDAYYINDWGESPHPTIEYRLASSCGRSLLAKVFPNPVANILNVEIEESVIKRAKYLQPTSRTIQEPTFDIRLYDVLGNLLRQQSTKGNSVQFNVSNLPNGVYYLHVYDAVNPTPEMQQIVIEH